MARSFLLLSILKELYNEESLSRRKQAERFRSREELAYDEDYIQQYRLNKDLIHILGLELCMPQKRPKHKNNKSLNRRKMILCTLSFLASGSYQELVGSNIYNYVSQPSMSRCINEVVNALCEPNMVNKYIRFPQNHLDRLELKKSFYDKFNIPDCIGCVECTLVPLIRPKQNAREHHYRHRRYAKNIQLVVDADSNILHVDVSHGATYSDSQIFNESEVKNHLEELTDSNESIFLLGGSSFCQRRYLMVPVMDAVDGTPEAHYNEAHASAYSAAASAIASLKARFRCLLANRALNYTPEVVGKIVIACCVLHNMCNSAGLPAPALSERDVAAETDLQSNKQSPWEEDLAEFRQGVVARRGIIETLNGP